jgi:hypothetical protein
MTLKKAMELAYVANRHDALDNDDFSYPLIEILVDGGVLRRWEDGTAYFF